MNSELQYLESLQGSGIRPGLQRMRAFLRAAGHPERALPAVLVAGTNGKGSTAATLASILSAGGFRCGLYTSPHLLDLRERWMIDRVPVAPAVLRAAIRELRRVAGLTGVTPTYFEAMTILAFLIFRDLKCDIAVLEVGMGGRLDATNVVRPLLSLVSSVSRDHMEFLGSTVRAIAREKAGIIHRGSTALTSSTDPVVIDVLRQRCARVGAPLHIVSKEVDVRDAKVTADHLRFRLRTPGDQYVLGSPLTGAHQVANVTLAVRAAEDLRNRFGPISREAIQQGVAATRWRGRLERFSIDGRDVFVDGGHNAGAAERIADFTRQHLRRPRALVFGIMRDKEVEKVVSILFPLFDDVILTEPSTPRAASVDELRALAISAGVPFRGIRRPASAVARAIESGARSVLVCGSLYLAGDAVRFLDRRAAAKPAAIRRRADNAQLAATRARFRPKRSTTVQLPGGR